MRKLNFKYFSKKSLVVRLTLSALLIAFLILIFLFESQISRFVYKWDENQINSTSQVSFIDVGQGDATLLEFCDGKKMLVDCGAKSSADELVAYLKNRQIKTIDYFLVTHADADHVGGGVAIFKNFDVLEFYRPMTYSLSEEKIEDYPVHDTIVYDDLIKASIDEQCKMFFTSNAISWGSENGDYFVQVLYPDKAYDENNDSSAVIKATIEDVTYLLMGDADIGIENKLIEEYGAELHCDVLKVGHHGSDTSTSEEFVRVASPNYSIISVGENSYGHPTQEVLDILNSFGSTVLTTLEKGDILSLIGNGRMQIIGVDGKHIDLAMITVIVCLIVLALFGIPDLPKRQDKTNKKN